MQLLYETQTRSGIKEEPQRFPQTLEQLTEALTYAGPKFVHNLMQFSTKESKHIGLKIQEYK